MESNWEAKAQEFHAANPQVYGRLLEMVRELHATGVRRHGVDALWNVLRWEPALKTASATPFKLNDAFPAWYARKIMAENPELDGFFALRDSRPRRRTGRDWRRQAEAFHAANPHVYERLRRSALELRATGVTRYGLKAFYRMLRWERDLSTEDAASRYRLNHNYQAWYSRKLMTENPELAGFFATRSAGGFVTEGLL